MKRNAQVVSELKTELDRELEKLASKTALDSRLETTLTRLNAALTKLNTQILPEDLVEKVEDLKKKSAKSREPFEKTLGQYAVAHEAREMHKENLATEMTMSSRKRWTDIISGTTKKSESIALDDKDVQETEECLKSALLVLGELKRRTEKTFSSAFSNQKEFSDASKQLNAYLSGLVKLMGEEDTKEISKLIQYLVT